MWEIRLGPIEWGVVTAHNPWGLGVRLEESGDEGVMVLTSIHDDPRYCDSEYWPDVGALIRVRRYIYRSPNDEVRLTSCESAMEGLVGGYDPPRQYPPPEGSGPAQEGTVVAHRDWGVEVRLDSGQIGQLQATLIEESADPTPEERWPDIGERVRIRPPGFWPRRQPASEQQTPLCGRDAQTLPVAGETAPLKVRRPPSKGRELVIEHHVEPPTSGESFR